MKKLFFALLFAILFGVSAGAVEENCLSDDKLSFDKGVAYANQGIPYTGCMYSNYPNGNLHYRGTLKEGRLEGVYKQYYSTGQLELEESYVGGLKQGVAKLYWEDGTLKGENTYVNDKLNGPYKKYHKNGRLHVDGTYKNNLLDGRITVYFEDGKVKYSNVYQAGKKVYQTRKIVLSEKSKIMGTYIPKEGREKSLSAPDKTKTVDAIVVSSVSDEYAYLRQEYPKYQLLQQALIMEDKKPMDVLAIRTAEGEKKEIYFDISSFYGTY